MRWCFYNICVCTWESFLYIHDYLCVCLPVFMNDSANTKTRLHRRIKAKVLDELIFEGRSGKYEDG